MTAVIEATIMKHFCTVTHPEGEIHFHVEDNTESKAGHDLCLKLTNFLSHRDYEVTYSSPDGNLVKLRKDRFKELADYLEANPHLFNMWEDYRRDWGEHAIFDETRPADLGVHILRKWGRELSTLEKVLWTDYAKLLGMTNLKHASELIAPPALVDEDYTAEQAAQVLRYYAEKQVVDWERFA